MQRNSDGETLFMVASQEDDLDTLEIIYAARGNVNSIKRHDVTALMLAAQNGHTDAVKKLISYGAEINAIKSEYASADGGYSALMFAVQNGHSETVQTLPRC